MSSIVYKSSVYIEPVNSSKSDKTVRDFRCSTCWGRLNAYPQPQQISHIHLDLVLCVECGEDTRGYVHKSAVERKRTEDHFNAKEVKKAYPGLDPNKKEKKSAEDNIKELGL